MMCLKDFGEKNTSDKQQIKITDHFTARTVFNTVLTGEEMLDLVRDLCTGDTQEPQPNPSAQVEMAKEKPVNRGTFKKLLHTFSINSTQIRRLGCLDLVMQIHMFVHFFQETISLREFVGRDLAGKFSAHRLQVTTITGCHHSLVAWFQALSWTREGLEIFLTPIAYPCKTLFQMFLGRSEGA